MNELWQMSFPGMAIMPNWHPLFVHFPIVLLTGFFLLDLSGVIARKAEWRRVAGGLLYAGALFAIVTVALGVQAEHSVAHGGEVHPILMSHEKHGFAVLTMALLLSLWRLARGERWSALGTTLHLLLAGTMVAIMIHGADLGGLMVYGHGVGVRGVQQEHSHDHDHGDEQDDDLL